MNTITVTCPEDGERFVVVEPENSAGYESLTATCPSCNERFAIVYPDELQESEVTKPSYEPLAGRFDEWETREDPPAPYTGSDKNIPHEQYVTAKIAELGGPPGVDEESELYEEAAPLEPDRFQIWYTPEHEAPQWKEIAYVVRADLETGVKTKNVYALRNDADNSSNSLFIKNRGVPRNSDKQWTYLDRAECHARAVQAQLDPERITEHPDQEDRYHISLTHAEQPLINEDGELAEELVMELARMLVAFQTKRIA